MTIEQVANRVAWDEGKPAVDRAVGFADRQISDARWAAMVKQAMKWLELNGFRIQTT